MCDNFVYICVVVTQKRLASHIKYITFARIQSVRLRVILYIAKVDNGQNTIADSRCLNWSPPYIRRDSHHHPHSRVQFDDYISAYVNWCNCISMLFRYKYVRLFELGGVFLGCASVLLRVDAGACELNEKAVN